MSYLSLLINRCNVVRPTVAEDHGAQEKSYNTGSPVAVNLKCRIQFFSSMATKGSGGLDPTPHGYEIVEGYFGFFEFGANVLIDDLIVDEKGRQFIVVSAPEDVTGMLHHVECKLSIVD